MNRLNPTTTCATAATLALFACLVVSPTVASAQDDRTSPSVPYMVVAAGPGEGRYAVLADSAGNAGGIPSIADLKLKGTTVMAAALPGYLKALASIASERNTDDARCEAGVVIVGSRRDAAAPVLRVLLMCAQPDVQIGRVYLVNSNGDGACELLIPRDPAAPVGVPQQFRFRAVEGVSAAYSVSPEPINEFFRSTGWPGDKPMSAAPAFVFWQLESQLRRGSSIIGDRVALRFDAGVPADALHRGFDLLARINDGVEPRDQKQLALQIEVAPASNDDNTGDAPLPRVVPGANALTALQVRATHRVIVQAVEPDAALVPPSRPIDDSATPAPAGDVRHSGQHVLLALKWLRDHQADDGSWDPVEFGAAGNAHGRTTGRYGNVNGTGDTGWKQARAGVTGIALLAFLGAGYTHTEGEFANTVKKALRYLKLIQDNDGVFDTTNRADTHYIYGHAICSLAMVEAFALTGSNILKGPAQKALDFIAAAQNKVGDLTGGWRYGIRPGDSDTSITAWMALALHSARVAGLKVPADGMAGAVRHMELMTASVNGYPKTGYIAAGGSNARLQEQARFAPNPTTDAMNVLVRILASDGEARENAVLVAQSRVITSIDNRPTLRNPDKIDYYYWHWASLAMFQMGGEYWTDWQRPLADALARSQRLEGGRESDRCYGSWDTNSAWGVAGGRVYTTAINCLTLESYFRYERMAVRQRADNNADGGR